VYDPQGFYQENGQPGPYSVGIWSTWMSAQPNGRPSVQLPADGGRCGPRMIEP
ncbi:MAG: spirocyclase AveC family protein, partial [Mycobacterium sp.]